MPFFQLTAEDISFPPAYFADSEGLIAVGGDLKYARILKAYQNGIYFWFGPMDPIKWWSPDPRLVIYPAQIELKNPDLKTFEIQINKDFTAALHGFQKQENIGSMGPHWVTEEMKAVYSDMHLSGNAQILDLIHQDNAFSSILGITIGSIFFVEYILIRDTSELQNCVDQSILALSSYLAQHGFRLIDVQKETVRISDIEIQEISRLEYLDLLQKAVSAPSIPLKNMKIAIQKL